MTQFWSVVTTQSIKCCHYDEKVFWVVGVADSSQTHNHPTTHKFHILSWNMYINMSKSITKRKSAAFVCDSLMIFIFVVWLTRFFRSLSFAVNHLIWMIWYIFGTILVVFVSINSGKRPRCRRFSVGFHLEYVLFLYIINQSMAVVY